MQDRFTRGRVIHQRLPRLDITCYSDVQKRHKIDAVGKICLLGAQQTLPHRQRERGLAHPTWSNNGQEPAVSIAKALTKVDQFLTTTDKSAQRLRKIGWYGVGR